MAQPTTRSEFKEWCLRKLGKPVLEINVDDTQVEDRIDEAISYWNDYHFDGTEKLYLKHQITNTDKDNGYIPIPDNIIGVVNIFNLSTSPTFSSNIFSAKYQFILNHIHELTDYNLVHFYMSMQHIQFMEEILAGRQPIRFNRHTNKLYVDTAWKELGTGDYIVAECYQVLDPTVYTDMWKDRWLQNYATAKIKYQWGSNLTKLVGLQLPGGVQFNGDQILKDAEEEIRRLEEEMIVSYSLPVHDLTG